LDGATPRASALIIAGAAGKGPYAAGALKELARDKRFDVRHVAGTSSGALNAAVYAAGLRVGAEAEAAAQLWELWRTKANWHRIISHKQRVKIVKDALECFRGRDRTREVSLELVVATLRGRHDKFGGARFEQVVPFETKHFETSEGTSELAERCIQSSTIPILFPPRTFKDQGQFWDGGIVNNTPIGNALKWDRQIDHVLVITPDSLQVESPKVRHGWLALNRLLEMVIEERLSRDLYEARSFNLELAALCRAGIDLARLGPDIKWRLLQLVVVRPEQDLPGSLVTGFLRPDRRQEYLKIGEDTAKACLAKWEPEVFDTKPKPFDTKAKVLDAQPTASAAGT